MAIPIDLSGRTILVTGAAGGIGGACSRMLSEAGATVVKTDISSERPSDSAGERWFPADLRDEASVERLFEEASASVGRLDGIVNNAGVIERVAGTRRQSLVDWQHVMDVNLRGVYLIARTGSRHMRPGSAMVNMASIVGISGVPASNAYGVSKAGVIMMTKTLACDLARFGIRVNAVAPGVIEAPMSHELLEQGPLDQEMFRRRTPMGRLGKPEEVANAVTFLLSDLAAYITGITLAVDGGWTAFGGVGNASE